MRKSIEKLNINELIELSDLIFSEIADRKYSNGKVLFYEEENKLRQLYLRLINNIKVFYTEIGITDPIGIFRAFIYSYKNGFLSLNKNFKVDSPDDDFIFLLGLNVIKGSGICRHLSVMLKDIMEFFGYETMLLDMHYKVIQQGTKYKIIKDNKYVNLKYAKSNHMVVYVKDKECSYIFDPLKELLLIPVGKGKLVRSTDDTNTLQKCICNNICYYKLKKNNFVTKGQYEDRINLVCENLLSQKEKFEEFYIENYQVYKDINELMDMGIYVKVLHD